MELFSDNDIMESERAYHNQEFSVTRRVYKQETLHRDADYQMPLDEPLGFKCKKAVKSCGFGQCLLNSVPIVQWLPKYDVKAYLVSDIIAGAINAIMHIPQGMAFALLAGIPPIVGLYMAFFPVLIYVIFGTSTHISLGTSAMGCLMAGKTVSQYATQDILETKGLNDTTFLATTSTTPYTTLQVISILSLTSGLFQIAMWMLRLGSVSALLTEPLVSGFTIAASHQVLISQLKDLIGIRIQSFSGNFNFIFTFIEVCKNLPNINWATFIISAVACTVLVLNADYLKAWISKRSKVPFPMELVVVVVGTVVSSYMDLQGQYDIRIVGNIPTGLPVPEVPTIDLMPKIAVDALSISIVTYTICLSISFIFASKEGYKVDANQELLALGASNVFGSFFTCAPLSVSFSRCLIQYEAGVKTLITGVVSALVVLCVLLWIGPLFEKLPRSILASIMVVSLKRMFLPFKTFKRFWELSRWDAVVWLVSFLTTVIINIDIGLACGVIASAASLFLKTQASYTCLLGRVDNTDLYLDCKRYKAAQEIPGVKIFLFSGGLNFATESRFRSILFKKINYPKSSGDPEKTFIQKVKYVIIDAAAITYVDTPGIKCLIAVQKELNGSGIKVLFAGANAPVLEFIQKYNNIESDKLILEVFPTVHDAVIFYKNILESKKADTPIIV